MGFFLTAAEVVTYLGTERARNFTTDAGASPDTTVIDTEINIAEGISSGYIVQRGDVPLPFDLLELPSLGSTLKGIVRDIAVYRLATRRPPVAEEWKKAHEDAFLWLAKFAKREITSPDITAYSTIAASGGNDDAISTLRDT
ncbi:MAG: phage protein Gp36 family protein [Planctomycetota bacterium]